MGIDALHIGYGVEQLFRQVQRGQQVGTQGEQGFAQRLQLGAFALELGLARGAIGIVEFLIEFTAFGNELTLNVITFFGFS